MQIEAVTLFRTYPSLGFQIDMKIHTEAMDRRCHKAKGIVRMLKKVVKAEPIRLAVDHERYKRFIGELALLLSGYSVIEIQYLSSRMDKVEQAQSHIIAAVEGLSHVVEKLQKAAI